ncbi:hypothetical protein AAFF_G00215680 [Aldrovandia affinis]|uniref:Ig-like domain-containing protein n=1 Tax=Aldrovandia affinis TaxID=143900 RepID=A0AAD7W4B0_9TELE|nr:hypothetical protein AAFF_G00215680 [Aldrovandia affinis]
MIVSTGTQVTVDSGEQTLPTVFPLLGCGPVTGGYVTVGCMATGFMPDMLTFTWASKAGAVVSDIIQYPSVKSGSKYTVISQAKVTAADWGADKSLQCTAEHPAGKVEAPLVMPPKHEQPAHVYLMTPSPEEQKNNKTATFACFASKFAPRKHSFTWLRNDKEISEGVTTLPEVKQNGEKEVYSATSFLHLNDSQWRDAETSVSCEFKHKFAVKKTAVYSQGCLPDNPVIVTIIPPSNEDLFLNSRVTLSCKITGDLSGIESVVWKKEDNTELVSTHEVEGNSDVYKLQISNEDWANGTMFTCTVQHSDSAIPIKKHYRRENGGKQQPPSVFILAPAEQPSKHMVTLTCYAKEFYPKEVLISWLADDEPVTTDFQTTEVVKTGNTYSVYSEFPITAGDWESGIVYSCVVHHEAANKLMRTIVRTIDSQSKKPTTVSLNLGLNQDCKV